MKEEALTLAAGLCRRFEGIYLNPYLCPAGVATIGIGSTRYEDGRRVSLSDPAISLKRAEDLLIWEISTVCLPAVMRLCPGIDTPGRLAALLDFAYNVGAGNLRASTLRKRITAGRWEDVPGELRKWNRGGGRVLPGLVRRREAEAALIWLH